MELLLLIVFVLGYAAIAFEHSIHIDKAASALLIGALCWTLYVIMGGNPEAPHQLVEQLSEVSQILLFLLAAMTVVELIDAYNGFSTITKRIHTRDKKKLLWIICLVSFFLSSALDNLATTIVMVSMLRKLLSDREDRITFVSMVIISVNAGGAWSPIGDVTTTMLWIGNRVTSFPLTEYLFLPSLMCLIVPLSIVSMRIKGDIVLNGDGESDAHNEHGHGQVSDFERRLIFIMGFFGLILVPVFKNITHLPPYMGITFSLSILWITTEIIRKKNKLVEVEGKDPLSVVSILTKVDVPSVLFFLGILEAVGCLQAAGMLKEMALFLDQKIENFYAIGYALGILSSIVDNVPLVAACMGMYDLATYPTDDPMWHYIAFCAGTGGSSLIIGSAAGVAAMGMEKIDFMWYLKKFSWLAFIGYTAGAITFILMHVI